jgi:transcription elongation factor Elf1
MKIAHHMFFVCPYCRAKISAVVDNQGKHLDCGDCGKQFVAWTETDVTYYTRDLEGGQALKAAISKPSTNRSIR